MESTRRHIDTKVAAHLTVPEQSTAMKTVPVSAVTCRNVVLKDYNVLMRSVLGEQMVLANLGNVRVR